MRALATACVTCILLPLALAAQQPAPGAGAAAAWNGAPTLRLVDRAIARRSAQLADTGLADFTAQAHGYVTFLAQVGDGFPDPPRVMKTDELAVEVYWRAPDQSKQRIIGRRDTLLLPTDIQYHRDHLAIIQNNFPSIIRLGDGDEVRDVPHPLSPEGRLAYDFAIADSLTMRTNDRAFEVVMVNVRPKDDRLPRAVGAIYIDRATATVVRMTFSFTRSALRDKYLEDVSVVLENGLVDGRFWLPRRQEIEITRSGSWMDFPSRGIIRGRWEICCARVNSGVAADLFRGPEIVQLPQADLRRYEFKGAILDRLPDDVQAATDDNVRAVQDAARELVRAEALSRVRTTNPAARSVSDIVRVNRVEGLAIGGGVRRRLGAGVSANVRARYGTASRQGSGALTLAWQRADGASLVARAVTDFADAGDAQETSGLRNSLAAQEFGADYTDPYRERVLAVSGGRALGRGLRWTLGVERRQERALALHATPSSGRYEPVLAATALQAWRLGGDLRQAPLTIAGMTLSWHATAFAERARIDAGPGRGTSGWLGRGVVTLDASRHAAAGTVVMRSMLGGLVGGFAPPAQRLVRIGGPVTAPGFGFHQFSGRAAFTQRAEWQHGIPFVPMSLGRFGRVPSTLTLAPFVSTVWVDTHGAAGQGWHAAAGLGVLAFFDQLRVDVARGARDGRWTFSVDLAPSLWPIL